MMPKWFKFSLGFGIGFGVVKIVAETISYFDSLPLDGCDFADEGVVEEGFPFWQVLYWLVRRALTRN